MIHSLYCPACGYQWPTEDVEAHFEATSADTRRNEVRYVVTAKVSRRCPTCGQGEQTPVPFRLPDKPRATNQGRT